MSTPATRTRHLALAAAVLAAATLATGCASKFEKRLPDYSARAVFFPTGEPQPVAGTKIQGTIEFSQNKGVLVAKGEIKGLKPNSTVGFHVHEKGSCMKMDASDAGPHFNPGKAPHGAFDGKEAHHAGDLPPLKADATGKAVVNFTTQAISLDKSAENGVIGRAIVVHESADDPTAQPAGNSGKRLACGVIRLT
ncbi:superoxide dismutase family protein [Comamonas serinivorans]|nr:superoxide dismutase family protein [Comamonas serinivorans]